MGRERLQPIRRRHLGPDAVRGLNHRAHRTARLPEQFLPEFPPAIYLTTRSDLGDVSQGKLVTLDNFYELFNGILNPKQLEGLRILVTPFPQQQFNATEDRRSVRPSLGVTCLD